MKRIYKALSTVALAIIIVCMVVGCAKEPVVAVVNGEKILEPMYRIFLWSTERGLEAIVPDIWEIDTIEGKTPEEFAKERAIKSVTYYIAVEAKAKEANIKLSSDEKKEIKISADKIVEDNSNFVKEYGIKDSHFEKFLEYGKLEEKVISEVGKTYIPNDEEIANAKEKLTEEGLFAEIATISHILFRNINELGERLPEDKNEQVRKEAEAVLMSALKGEDINLLAVEYSEDKAVSQNKGEHVFSRGQMEKAIEDVVFENAKEGEVYPQLVETSVGYEIIKVENISKLTEEEKQTMASERVQQEFVSNEIASLGESYVVKKNEEYDEIHIMKINNTLENE